MAKALLATIGDKLWEEEIIKALKDDNINLIGICGLPGVGKTTMAKEIGKRTKEDGLFVEVAWAEVGQTQDIAYVQACIADMLGLKQLGDMLSPEVRAKCLRERLLQDNKEILVILDDVWADFDLEDMGIPLSGANKNFKMLYTSRNRDLWYYENTKIEIPLELLSEDEAWKLLREQVGDCVDAPDLQPIAKQIVNECRRLPLVLVLFGKALPIKNRYVTKNIWEDIFNRLTCSSSAADLPSALELCYQAVEDEEAKRLFLLCCLFKADKSISVEDLARYALGLSLFDDGTKGMRNVRARVFYLVADLESRFLLLDYPDKRDHKHVKVHPLVRNMGTSIASKYKGALGSHGTLSEYPKKDAYEYALVSHCAVFEWPNKEKFQHYTSISVTSENLTELPEELKCPNLEFLLLRCNIPRQQSSTFFKGMGKLKVLELDGYYDGIFPTLQPLTNLTMLSLACLNRDFDGYKPVIEPVIGDLLNLEVLSFRNLAIEELPEEIGKLVKLRLLDLTGTSRLRRIPQGVISGLVGLEELYCLESNFDYWEGEGKKTGSWERKGEKEGRNANLREFEFLSHLNTLEICASKDVLIPKVPIFRNLKKYKVVIRDCFFSEVDLRGWKQYRLQSVVKKLEKYERGLVVEAWGGELTADDGGLDSLLRSSDHIHLVGPGCNDLVRELLLQNAVDGLQQLKCLEIEHSNTECLANTMNWVKQPPNAAATAVFPILERMSLSGDRNLREICHGPVPAGSFGRLTEIEVYYCDSLRYLFLLPVVECLTQLRRLQIHSSNMMEEVIRRDVHTTTNNRIEFPKLEYLNLGHLPCFVGFCKGIDQIDFPRLKDLHFKKLSKLKGIVDVDNSNNILRSLSLFPQKVTFPSLETLALEEFKNESIELPAFLLSKLKVLEVARCGSLRNLFYPSVAAALVNLQRLIIRRCPKMETIVDWEEGQEREIPRTLFPQLIELDLSYLPCLTRFCHFTHPIELPLLRKIEIWGHSSMNFSFGHVSTPNLYLQGVFGSCNVNKIKRKKKKKLSKNYYDFTIPNKQDLSTPDPKSRGEKDSRSLQLQVHQNSDAIVRMSDRGSTSGGTAPEGGVLKELDYFPMEGCLKPAKPNLYVPDVKSKGEEDSERLQLQHHQDSDPLIGISDHGITSGTALEGGALPLEEFVVTGQDLFPGDEGSLTKLPDELSHVRVLSYTSTSMYTLPHYIFGLVELQKLLLRNSEILMMELPPQIGGLEKLEVLDLEGTEILCLPVEIAKLVKLTCLKVSFYGYASQPVQTVIPRGVLSNLSCLKELIIDVTPYGKWWDDEVKAIIEDLSSLKDLTTLKLYLPTAELLEEVTSKFPGLANFRFTVGHQEEHFISRLPRDVEEEFNNWEKLEKGLKFINGDLIPDKITKVLKHANAFFLQRHWTAESLSKFGHENLKEVKFFLVMECNEFRTIIDSEKSYKGKDGSAESEDFPGFDEAMVLVSLERLIIRYMKNMESIWKGPVGKRSLSNLKSLALHTCPNLTTLFTIDMLSNLKNLEELIVEDCSKINSLVSLKNSGSESVLFLPSLKKISLLLLPGLVSISSGLEIAPKLERMLIYHCPKLEKLSTAEVSSAELKVIKGEKEWWDALKWYESDVSTKREDDLACLFISLRRDVDVMAQLTDD